MKGTDSFKLNIRGYDKCVVHKMWPSAVEFDDKTYYYS